jgi:hypothetical protein
MHETNASGPKEREKKRRKENFATATCENELKHCNGKRFGDVIPDRIFSLHDYQAKHDRKDARLVCFP